MSPLLIDEAKLIEIVRRLVEAVKPDRIVLLAAVIEGMRVLIAIWTC